MHNHPTNAAAGSMQTKEGDTIYDIVQILYLLHPLRDSVNKTIIINIHEFEMMTA